MPPTAVSLPALSHGAPGRGRRLSLAAVALIASLALAGTGTVPASAQSAPAVTAPQTRPAAVVQAKPMAPASAAQRAAAPTVKRTAAPIQRVTAAPLNLRKGPSTKTKSLVLIPRGTTLSIGASKGGWSKVAYKKKTGWVSSAYLGTPGRVTTAFNVAYKGSRYQLYANGIDFTKPVGVLYWFDGDAPSPSFPKQVSRNPTGSFAQGIVAEARKKNLIVVAPVTPAKPTRADGYTWWVKGPSNAAWFRGLQTQLNKKLKVKRSNVFYAGRSGGAEFITYELNAHRQSLAGTGGAVIIAGGGKPDRFVRPARSFTSTPMTWIVGDKDRAGQTNPPAWSAYTAAKQGRAYYVKRGFTRTQRVILKGVNHYGYDNAKLVGKYLGRPR